jgi:hypothetical protein
LTSPEHSGRRRKPHRLSLEDEDIGKRNIQKLKNEDSKEEKDFALVVEKGCNYLS